MPIGTEYAAAFSSPRSSRKSILGFTPEQTAIVMTFYLALACYGPAANVTGDGAVAIALDRFFAICKS